MSRHNLPVLLAFAVLLLFGGCHPTETKAHTYWVLQMRDFNDPGQGGSLWVASSYSIQGTTCDITLPNGLHHVTSETLETAAEMATLEEANVYQEAARKVLQEHPLRATYSGTPSPPVSSYPRFQIFNVRQPFEQAVLLDTDTGRSWVRSNISDLSAVGAFWKYEDRLDSPESYFKFLDSTKSLVDPPPSPEKK